MRAHHTMWQLVPLNQLDQPRAGHVQEIRRLLRRHLGIVQDHLDDLAGTEVCKDIGQQLHRRGREYERLRRFAFTNRNRLNADGTVYTVGLRGTF